MAKTIRINSEAFHLNKDDKKFIVLGSNELEKKDFIDRFVNSKIKKESKTHHDEFWGTLGLTNDKPVDWKGYLEISNKGNKTIEDNSIKEEIGYLKTMYPNMAEDEITERFISFEHLDIEFPEKFKTNEIPEIRLTLMLKKDEGALVFYSHSSLHCKNNEVIENKEIEYIQPEPTFNYETNNRDRLTYKFKAIPNFKYERANSYSEHLKLSDTKNNNPFVVKILTFNRGSFENSTKTIVNAKSNIFNKFGVFSSHKLKIYKNNKQKFVNLRGKIDESKKTLFLVHGTFGSTKQSFGDLYLKNNWLDNLLDDKIYEQIIGYDHPTIFSGAEENITELLKLLKNHGVNQFTKEVDFIGTSQGGLLIQYLANLNQPYIKVGKVALVASANGVDYLTSAEYVPKFLSYIKHFTKITGALEASVICAIAQHSAKYLLHQPGFKVMTPKSKELLYITDKKPVGDTCYLPVIGDFNETLISDKRKWKQWTATGIDTISRLIMGKFNDWVVSSQKQFLVPSEYCVIPNYDEYNFVPYIIPAIHGTCLSKPVTQKILDDFFSMAQNSSNKCLEFDTRKYTNINHKILPPATKIRYDAHFHLLCQKIITKRLFGMFLETLKDLEKNIKLGLFKKKEENSPKALKLIKYLLLNKDCNDSFYELVENYEKTDPSVQKFIPLLVDFEFIFRTNYHNNTETNNTKSNLKKVLKEFNSGVDVIKSLIKHYPENIDNDSLEILKEFIEFASENFDHTKQGVLDKRIEHLETGFESQLECMKRLKKIHKDNFYPFFAVDPRREDIMDIVKKNVEKSEPSEKDKKEKLFAGIKLYPPLGYSPTDPFLMGDDEQEGLYCYCIKNDIPVLTHCSSGGFSNFVDKVEVIGWVMPSMDAKEPVEYKTITKIKFDTNFLNGFNNSVKERAYRLNHPKLWEIVLKKHPNLKINFAHFGGDDPIRRKAIYELMSATNEKGEYLYPNVYTDVSCIVDQVDLDNIYDEYFSNNAHPELKKKFMYGTDYALNMIWENSFTQYYNKFKDKFNGKFKNDNEFDLISINNVESFLFDEIENKEDKNCS